MTDSDPQAVRAHDYETGNRVPMSLMPAPRPRAIGWKFATSSCPDSARRTGVVEIGPSTNLRIRHPRDFFSVSGKMGVRGVSRLRIP